MTLELTLRRARFAVRASERRSGLPPLLRRKIYLVSSATLE